MMNVALWVVQVLLALVFLIGGLTKTFQTGKAKQNMAWARDYSAGYVKFIGICELMGATGLLLPQAIGLAPVLTPLAASGLAIIMILAASLHFRRGEKQLILLNIILLVLCLIVATGRF